MNFKNRDRNKLIIKVILLFVLFFVVFSLIMSYVNKLYKLKLYEFSNIVISNIHENYHYIEEDVIKEVFIKNSNNEILNEYGINEETINFKCNNVYFTEKIYIIIYL